jgi:intracellular septation protein A
MVQMKSTVLGLLTAMLFFGDGFLRRGAYFGERMQRYMPAPVNTSRMAMGLGMLGLCMAGANYAVANLFSEDAWLTYTTFLDMPLSVGLAYAVFSWAKQDVPADQLAVDPSSD